MIDDSSEEREAWTVEAAVVTGTGTTAVVSEAPEAVLTVDGEVEVAVTGTGIGMMSVVDELVVDDKVEMIDRGVLVETGTGRMVVVFASAVLDTMLVGSFKLAPLVGASDG